MSFPLYKKPGIDLSALYVQVQRPEMRITPEDMENPFGKMMGEITQKIVVNIESNIDNAIADEVIAFAKRCGVTDLVLLDRQFVLDALVHENERREREAAGWPEK